MESVLPVLSVIEFQLLIRCYGTEGDVLVEIEFNQTRIVWRFFLGYNFFSLSSAFSAISS